MALAKAWEEWSLRARGVPRLKEASPEWFPAAERTGANGLLAVGGQLRAARLLSAYRHGVFPTAEHSGALLWWSPPSRFVIDLSRQGGAAKRAYGKGPVEIRLDSAFGQVVAMAQRSRAPLGNEHLQAWLEAFGELNALGYAHSVEAWAQGRLQSGLYGVCLGGAWVTQGSFSHAAETWNELLACLTQRLREWGFCLYDCQRPSTQMARFGAESWPRRRFLARLEAALEAPGRMGPWSELSTGPAYAAT